MRTWPQMFESDWTTACSRLDFLHFACKKCYAMILGCCYAMSNVSKCGI